MPAEAQDAISGRRGWCQSGNLGQAAGKVGKSKQRRVNWRGSRRKARRRHHQEVLKDGWRGHPRTKERSVAFAGEAASSRQQATKGYRSHKS